MFRNHCYFRCFALGIPVLLILSCSGQKEEEEDSGMSESVQEESASTDPVREREDLDEILAKARQSEEPVTVARPSLPEPPVPDQVPSPPEMPANFPAGLSSPPPYAPGALPGKSITVRMDPPLGEIGRAWKDGGGAGQDFTMPLPDGSEAVVRVDRFVAVGEDGGEFEGTLEGYPDSEVRLSYRGGGEVGSIRIPSEDRLIRIFPGQDGNVVLSETPLEGEAGSGLPPGLTVPPGPPPDFIPEPPPGMGN